MTAPKTSSPADAAWNPHKQGSAWTPGPAPLGEAGVGPTGCTATVHGPAYAFRLYGCTCPESRRAERRRRKVYELRAVRGERALVDATGTRRRLQALCALGWSTIELARRLDTTQQNVSWWATGGRKQVFPSTAAAVARLYDELADHQGPSRTAAAMARAKGWLVPLWWDDDTIDDPAHVPPTRETQAQRNREDRDERRATVARLTERGWSLRQIAAHLGTDERQVIRDRYYMRQEAS